MANTRLDKFLANAGAGTRSEVKTYIKGTGVSQWTDRYRSKF